MHLDSKHPDACKLVPPNLRPLSLQASITTGSLSSPDNIPGDPKESSPRLVEESSPLSGVVFYEKHRWALNFFQVGSRWTTVTEPRTAVKVEAKAEARRPKNR